MRVPRGWRDTRGSVLIEFAVVSLLLMTLVFGMIEYGLLISERLALQQAAREGARSAAIGETTAAVTTRVLASAAGVTITSSNVALAKMASGSSSWGSLGNSSDGLQNNAAFGDYVRVTLTFNHSWVTGLFSSSPTVVTAAMVARRE
jgi:Flp pilus assembly protein TadG